MALTAIRLSNIVIPIPTCTGMTDYSTLYFFALFSALLRAPQHGHKTYFIQYLPRYAIRRAG